MPAGRWADWVEPSARPMHLEPLFPIGGFTPLSPCPHRGGIRDGSSFCCMCCHDVNRARAMKILLSDAPDPLDPEIRIARWRRLMEQDDIFTEAEKAFMEQRIADILLMIDPGPQPTRYVPPPKPERKKTRKERRAAKSPPLACSA